MGNTYRNYAVLYNFSYMAIGALTPLIGPYLSYAGYTGAQIGTITATGTAVAIFASAFWGGIYSGSRRKYVTLMLLMIAASVMNGVLSQTSGFLPVLTVFGVMYFFQAPVMSLVDSFTVSRSGSDFGSLRTWGAVGFALGVFLTARLVDAASLKAIFPTYIGCFLIAAGAVFVINKSYEGSRGKANDPKVIGSVVTGAAAGTAQGRVNEDKEDPGVEERRGFRGYAEVLKDEKLRKLIICTFLMGGSNVANNTYFSFLYMEGGGTLAGVGVCMLIMVGSEAPFMAWSKRLADRFTMEKIILAAMVVSVIRFGTYAAGLPWWLLMVTGVSQGMVNGIILVEFVRYAAKLAPKGCRSLAISTYYVIGSNLSTIVCQLVGGLLLDHIGARGVYGFFALMNLTGVILYVFYGLYKSDTYSNKNIRKE